MAGHRHPPSPIPAPDRALACGRFRHGGPAAAVLAVTLLAAACGGGDDVAASAPADAANRTVVDAHKGDPEGDDKGADEGVATIGFTRFDGGKGTFADHLGKPLVVNFFASWCAPCVREMPEIERVHQELGDQVTFIGVDVRDRLAEGQELAARTGVTYELVRDPGGDVLTAFGGALLPTTAFVTADGHITLLQNHTYDAEELRAAVHEELLG